MGQNSHSAKPPHTQKQNNARSNDPKDGDRLTDKPGETPTGDEQDQATIEDFDREGMGVAGKE